MKKFIIKILIGIIVLAGILFTVNIFMSSPVDKNDQKEISFVVNNGATTDEIASILEGKDLIRNKFFFKLKSKLYGFDGKYFPGNYKGKKSLSLEELMKMLTTAAPGISVNIPEGTNTQKIAKILEKSEITTAENFLNEVENGKFNYDFLNEDIEGKRRLEGFLYPDTYNFEKGQDPKVVINTMLKNFEKNLDKDYKKLAKERGKSFYEIITIASIVEKEGVSTTDMDKVSSVIYNRLEIDMLLQMDSTVSYILNTDKIRLTYNDIEVNSPYNTYINKGLPPTPICSPSKNAIKAALKPAKTKYLYFVAGENLDGKTKFSENYDDFLKDKEKFDRGYEEYIKKNPGKE